MGQQAEFKFTQLESWSEKQEKLSGQKRRVFAEFIRLGDRGATIAEIAAIVANGHSNRVTQVIKDLRIEGLIEATEERRSVPGGKRSVVMKVAS